MKFRAMPRELILSLPKNNTHFILVNDYINILILLKYKKGWRG